MIAATLLVAVGSALASPSAATGEYDCHLADTLITLRVGDRWGSTNKFTRKNDYPIDTMRVALNADGTVSADLSENSLHLSGTYPALTTRDGLVTWSTMDVGYCGVIDAECRPTANFLPDGERGSLIIFAGSPAKENDRKSLGNIQIFYNCERAK